MWQCIKIALPWSNLDALSPGKKKRERDTSYTGHFHIVVNEHQFVQETLWEIGILKFQQEDVNYAANEKKKAFYFKHSSTLSPPKIERRLVNADINIFWKRELFLNYFYS